MLRRCRQDRMAAAIAATIKSEFSLITDKILNAVDNAAES